MSRRLARAAAAWLAAVCVTCVQAQALPLELKPSVPGAALSGQATMKFWGFEVYRATLWVAPGFAESNYAQSAFALDLAYLRNFKGADIAKRSLDEMRRQEAMTPAQALAWEGQMRALFPDVSTGDRITGVNQPGIGAVFWRNGQLLGEVRDVAFAQQFFGIWLSPQTSEPQLRRALLAQVSAAPAVRTAP
jgi:hypothetical protein